jgi:hypothetical protein
MQEICATWILRYIKIINYKNILGLIYRLHEKHSINTFMYTLDILESDSGTED